MFNPCSPSRSAILTGYYPIHTGMQTLLPVWHPVGLYTNITLLPEHLKKIGYKTHALGKWHLGFCNESYLPLMRGFDTFNGYIGGSADYYTHSGYKSHEAEHFSSGYDYRKNNEIDLDAKGIYQADLMSIHARQIINRHVRNKSSAPFFMYLAFHSVHRPIQVPKKYIEMYKHLHHKEKKKRIKMMAMVTAMDKAVGKIVKSLKNEDLFDNTLFFFTSDNGGRLRYGASNRPLKGEKFSLNEGGTKTAAFVSGPTILKRSGEVSNELIHITDWLPTFISMANGSSTIKGIDGFDQWAHFSRNEPGNRSEMLYGIGEEGMAALRHNEMKLLIKDSFCDRANVTEGIQLYNLKSDPSEENNLKQTFPEVVKDLTKRLAKYCDSMISSIVTGTERLAAANPARFGRYVSSGWCEAKP